LLIISPLYISFKLAINNNSNMKKTYLTLFTLILGIALVLPSCKPGGGVDPTSLADLIKGKTWRLGSITRTSPAPNTPADSKFASFNLTINAQGTGGSISYNGDNDTGGAGVNVNVTYTINNSSNTLAISGFSGNLANIWPSSPFNVTANETTLSFSIILTSPKTGAATYKFDLVRQ
jgi:hypothetical protein